MFKIETDLIPLLELCRELLSDSPRFVVLSCHTPGLTPIALQNTVEQLFKGAKVETGEMILEGSLPIPSGSFAKVLYA